MFWVGGSKSTHSLVEGNLAQASEAFDHMYQIAKERNLPTELAAACRASSRVAITRAARALEQDDSSAARDYLSAAASRAKEGSHADLLCAVAYYEGLAAAALGETDNAV